jgi:hypothetical protein
VQPGGRGYWALTPDGRILAFGTAPNVGDLASIPHRGSATSLASTPTGQGYWMLTSDGGVYAFGDAPFYGSMSGQRIRSSAVGLAVAPSVNGYWVVTDDGRVKSFGRGAKFLGSPRQLGIKLAQPIVGAAATPSGKGYWLVSADGGVFAFGDARFAGSLAGQLTGLSVLAINGHMDYSYTTYLSDGTARRFGAVGQMAA